MRTDAGTLRTQLEQILGPAQVLTDPAQNQAFALDGRVPALVVRPASQQQVAQVVRACAAAEAALIPWGGGTGMGLGNIPTRADLVLRMDGLDQVVEFDPANLSITVEAGMTLAALEQLITPHKIFLPLDPPQPNRATVGGMVAANQGGPGRLIYGTVRDWVLGLRVVLPHGEAIRCGGRVIKNVTGYDMPKFFINSMGTLGIVTEVTVKLVPMPVQRHCVVGVFPESGRAWQVVKKTLASFLLPEGLEYYEGPALDQLKAALQLPAGAGACALAVAVAGSPENVARQTRDFTTLFQDDGGQATTLEDTAAARAWTAMRDLRGAWQPGAAARTLCQVCVPISRVGELAAAARKASERCGVPAAIVAHAGSGVLWVSFPGPAATTLSQALKGLRQEAMAAQGTLVLHEALPALKEQVEVWGPPGEGLGVMRNLKAEFDPKGICNPGRFVGAI